MITDLDIPPGVNAATVFEEMDSVQCPAQTIKLSDKARSIKLETVDWAEVERREEMRRNKRSEHNAITCHDDSCEVCS